MQDRDELDDQIRRAAQLLRHKAPEQDKVALLRTLRLAADHPPTLRERLAIWWERRGSDLRQPIMGTAFAATLALFVGVGLSLDWDDAGAPEIDDIEFSGGSAMVIEQPSAHTTLIWLSEVDEEELGEEPQEELIETEEVVEEEVEVEDI